MKTYSELIKLPTFEERFEYLKIPGIIGAATFGAERYLNQIFYKSPEWLSVKRDIIIRDGGCDLAMPDRSIRKWIMVHHIEPITIEDVLARSPKLLDPENLITVSSTTHRAIHYGDKDQTIPTKPIERKPFDQCPWRKEG